MEKLVEIEKLDNFGQGIARIENIPIFIPNALPKEKVEIKITKQKKKFMEGEVVNYLNKSDDRIDAICPFYNFCGGCDLMHMDYEHQILFKQKKVEEIMHKFSLNVSIKPIIKTNQFYYRNKVTLQVKEKVGYYQKKSYDIVLIDKCLIANEKINEIINELSKLNLNGIKQIMIRNINGTMITFKGDSLDYSILDSFKDVDSIYFNDKLIYGKDILLEKIKEYQYYISSNSFFQVNVDGMIKLYDKVVEYCDFHGNEKVLDLYCGTGTIGIYVSKYCQEVFGIEINQDAIKDANKNKKINKISNISFACGDVGIKLKEKNFNPDIIIVDPPRSGLDNNAIEQIKKIKPEKIVYVSCDVMTLARDLKILEEYYEIKEITPVDMFPNTYHVECVCVLKCKQNLEI